MSGHTSVFRVARRAAAATAIGLALAMLIGPPAGAQQPVDSLRMYVLDCGDLGGASPLAVPVYLAVHPRGTLLWEAGTLPDALVESGGSTEKLLPNIRRAKSAKTLKSQLAQLGYMPDRITYFAMSHYHDDHSANANDYRSATWLVQKNEREAMFVEPPPPFADSSFYDRLKDSKAVVINNTDHDVFGDGSVVIKYAPGHTPGHQMLFLRLPRTGPLLLSGDLYHQPQEREQNLPVPNSHVNKEMSAATRASIETFIRQTGAAFWIQHDMALFRTLKKSPEYYD
jgi:N-acyl homoserine lactone hydrolase